MSFFFVLFVLVVIILIGLLFEFLFNVSRFGVVCFIIMNILIYINFVVSMNYIIFIFLVCFVFYYYGCIKKYVFVSF